MLCNLRKYSDERPSENITEAYTGIDNLCIPILRLGEKSGEKSVIKPKDLEKNYNKGPLP